MKSTKTEQAAETAVILTFFEQLLAIPAPSTQEQAISKFVFNQLKSWGYTPEQDELGNVWVRFAGRDESLPLRCFAAHLDEIGMTIEEVRADGTLAVGRSGGLRRGS